MPKDTTQIGQVGEPTSRTIADATDSSKAAQSEGSEQYFDQAAPDDFDGLNEKGLFYPTCTRLRRLSDGLIGIQGLTQILASFNLEREMRSISAGDGFQLLSARGEDSIVTSIKVLSDFLQSEIHVLGSELVDVYVKGGVR